MSLYHNSYDVYVFDNTRELQKYVNKSNKKFQPEGNHFYTKCFAYYKGGHFLGWCILDNCSEYCKESCQYYDINNTKHIMNRKSKLDRILN